MVLIITEHAHYRKGSLMKIRLHASVLFVISIYTLLISCAPSITSASGELILVYSNGGQSLESAILYELKNYNYRSIRYITPGLNDIKTVLIDKNALGILHVSQSITKRTDPGTIVTRQISIQFYKNDTLPSFETNASVEYRVADKVSSETLNTPVREVIKKLHDFIYPTPSP
jgi:hypothetical protein